MSARELRERLEQLQMTVSSLQTLKQRGFDLQQVDLRLAEEYAALERRLSELGPALDDARQAELDARTALLKAVEGRGFDASRLSRLERALLQHVDGGRLVGLLIGLMVLAPTFTVVLSLHLPAWAQALLGPCIAWLNAWWVESRASENAK